MYLFPLPDNDLILQCKIVFVGSTVLRLYSTSRNFLDKLFRDIEASYNLGTDLAQSNVRSNATPIRLVSHPEVVTYDFRLVLDNFITGPAGRHPPLIPITSAMPAICRRSHVGGSPIPNAYSVSCRGCTLIGTDNPDGDFIPLITRPPTSVTLCQLKSINFAQANRDSIRGTRVNVLAYILSGVNFWGRKWVKPAAHYILLTTRLCLRRLRDFSLTNFTFLPKIFPTE